MRLLLTRPKSDDDPLPGLLEAAGHSIIVEPLLSVESLRTPPLADSPLQAIAATSANAIRAAKSGALLGPVLELPLFAVGTATATAARDAGFKHIVEGPGTARDLVPFMLARLQPQDGCILYLRGEHVAFELAQELAQAGLAVEERVVYRAAPAIGFAAPTLKALRQGKIDGVVLLSPRTATIYAGLVSAAGLSPEIHKPTHYCLSDRVAAPLAALPGVATRISTRPSLQELVALIGLDATQSPPSELLLKGRQGPSVL